MIGIEFLYLLKNIYNQSQIIGENDQIVKGWAIWDSMSNEIFDLFKTLMV